MMSYNICLPYKCTYLICEAISKKETELIAVGVSTQSTISLCSKFKTSDKYALNFNKTNHKSI